MRKIKVLHICGSITSSGGVGVLLMNYYKNIDRDKIQFDFLTHHATDPLLIEEIQKLGGNVLQITPKSKGIFKNIIESFKVINKNSIHDVIHVHTASTTSFLYLLIARIAGKKVRIIHSHATNLEKPEGSFQHKIHKLLRTLVKLSATDYFACSRAAGEWLYGEKEIDKVYVLKNAIDIKTFVYDFKKSNDIKDKFNINGKLVVGSIGRMCYQKNQLFLLDIFNEICKINDNSVLLLVGDGELRNELEMKIKQLNLEQNVILTGNRNDVNDLLQAMDIFVLPSLFEGLPVVLIEAQASGLKVIASDTITDEVGVTDLFSTCSLGDSPQKWAEIIINKSDRYVREDQTLQIREGGYDIGQAAKWLELFYTNKIKS